MFYMNKKWLVGIAGVLMSVSLAACGSNSKSVATTNGGKITQGEYYSSLKGSSNGKQVLSQMILNKVLEHDYGSKDITSTVNNQFNQTKSQMGSQFSMALQQKGMTEDQLKDQIKSNLLLEQAVKSNADYSTSALKKQFKSYEPKVTVNAILTKNKSDAQNIIKQLNEKNGKNFSSLAKKYSQDSTSKNKGGRLEPFNNTASYDNNFKQAAFKLGNGKYTTSPVQIQYSDANGQQQTGYQIIQMVNKPNKGNYKDHINELKSQIAQNDMNDSSKLRSIVSKVLKKGGVNIQDNDLKNVLSGFLDNNSSK